MTLENDMHKVGNSIDTFPYPIEKSVVCTTLDRTYYARYAEV